MQQRKHTFSHFHLHITPQLLRIEKPARSVMECDRLLWYKLGEIETLGIAAPVMRLLKEIGETHEPHRTLRQTEPRG